MASSLATLSNRIKGDDNVASESSDADFAWLESFLQHWIVAEDEFFKVALEQEEKDAFSKAIDLHLVGKDEVPSSTSLRNYKRPSVARKINEEAKARAANEEHELKELRKKRKQLRTSIAKTKTLLQNINSKIVELDIRISQHKEDVIDSSSKCDRAISSTTALLEAVEAVKQDFECSPDYALKLQKIAHSLTENYNSLQKLSSIHQSDEEEEEDDLDRQSWILSRAYQRLEDDICQKEVARIVQQLEDGIRWADIVKDEPIELPPSAATTVKAMLQRTWQQDEALRLSEREQVLMVMSKSLQNGILPPLLLLYISMNNLYSHVVRIHALSNVLLSELEEFAARLEETQPKLTEEDELLLQLSDLLQIDGGEEGEVSEEEVLRRIRRLCT